MRSKSRTLGCHIIQLMPSFVGVQNNINKYYKTPNKKGSIMKESCVPLVIMMIMVLIIYTARLPVAGLIILDLSLKIMQIYPLENFDPLVNKD